MESEREPLAARLDTVVGLGANLGSRRGTLERAVRELARHGIVRTVSALYETLPVGGPQQPCYLNAAVRLSYAGAPPELLDALLSLERELGRERRERWGPRIVDLDILWIRDVVWKDGRLSVPHPRLRERAFALCPLLDVAPDAADPVDGVAYAEVLGALGGAGVVQIEGRWVQG